MADIFQGAPLPALTTTTEKQVTTPEFYTNYLQDIANLGQGAIQQGGIAGLSPLQMQAMQMAPTAAFSGAGSLGAAGELLGAAGTTAAPEIAGAYMNPYQSQVVDEMGRLQQKNIQENVLPGLQSIGVGSGGYGSQRQLQQAGMTMRDMQKNLLGQQYGALASGYQNAMTGAQADLSRQLQAGQGFGQLGAQQQQLATTGLNTLYGLGQKEQDLGQKMLDYPMQQAQAYSKLMQGYQVPTGEVSQVTGSSGYATSPLAQITGLMAALNSVGGQNKSVVSTTVDAASGKTKFNWSDGSSTLAAKDGGAITYAKDGGAMSSEPKQYPAGAVYTDGGGNYYDKDGYLVR